MLIIWVFMAAPLTYGYTLQGPHLLALMVQHMGKIRSLKVSQQGIAYRQASEEAEAAGEVTPWKETIWYRFPETFRFESVAENQPVIAVFKNNQSIRIENGRISPSPEGGFESYMDILLCRSRSLLEKRLVKWGVDVHRSSHGRLNGKPVYIIGARYPDETRSQVWLDKESFRPVRWIFVSGDVRTGTDKWEYHFFQWRKFGKIWYPRHIGFYRNQKRIHDLKITGIVTDSEPAGDLFDIRKLKLMHPSD